MTRLFAAVVLAGSLAAAARGHFTFILPDPGDAAAKVVFSDDLKPDPKHILELRLN